MNNYTKQEVADLIKRFVNGTIGKWEWDDFMSVKASDPEVERIRVVCSTLPDKYPTADGKGYCNQEGEAILLKLIEGLRK